MFITIQSDVMSKVGGPERQRHPSIALCPSLFSKHPHQIFIILFIIIYAYVLLALEYSRIVR